MRRFLFSLCLLSAFTAPALAGQYGMDTQAKTPAPHSAPSVIGPAASQFAAPSSQPHPTSSSNPQRAVDVEMGMSCGDFLSSMRSDVSDTGDLLDAVLSAYDISDRNGNTITAVHDKLMFYFIYFCRNRPANSTDDAAAYAKDAVDQTIAKALK